MNSFNLASPVHKIRLKILPYDGDIEAERRVRTLLELAIIIGKREGLIGNHIPDIPEVSTSVTSKE
ncbi:MAG: hypothetical protein FJ022_07865 [Chloroflexi bacterium]|nr:hypothetical protein [Chloroflexota bacterium]MBM4450690.1 hypothetical protein [Chloroflexota bacterium]